jgi:hypothetical protein
MVKKHYVDSKGGSKECHTRWLGLMSRCLLHPGAPPDNFEEEIYVQSRQFKKTRVQALALAGLALASAQAGTANLIQNGGLEASTTASYSPSNGEPL